MSWFSRKPKPAKEAVVPDDAFEEQPVAPVAPAAVPAGDCAELLALAAQAEAETRALADAHDAAQARCAAVEADHGVTRSERDAARRERDEIAHALRECQGERDRARAALAEASAVVSAKDVPCDHDCEEKAKAAFRRIIAIAKRVPGA